LKVRSPLAGPGWPLLEVSRYLRLAGVNVGVGGNGLPGSVGQQFRNGIFGFG
jgi:hypothetical protein